MSESESEAIPLLQGPVKMSRLRDVIMLGLAFLFLFSAFTVVQNLATSIFDSSVGFWSLGTLYIVFAFSTLVASAIVKALGLRLSMFLGGMTYIVYVIANIISAANEDDTTLHYYLMIPAGALEGFGGALLWTAQGAYLTFCSEETSLGLYSGIFFTLFISNQILGNVSAAILLNKGVETQLVFKILAAIAIFGLLVFGLLRPVKRPESAKEIPTFGAKLLEVLTFLADRRALLLAFLLIYSGITQSFFFGTLPLFIVEYGEMNDLSVKLYLMGLFGILDAIASSILGKLSDKVGRFPLILLGSFVHVTGYFLLFFAYPVNDLAFLIPVACLLGIGDAAFNTQIYGILGYMFLGSSEASFASYKFYRAASTGLLFFISDSMKGPTDGCPEDKSCPNMNIWLPVLLTPLTFGLIGLLYLRRAGFAIDVFSEKGRKIING